MAELRINIVMGLNQHDPEQVRLAEIAAQTLETVLQRYDEKRAALEATAPAEVRLKTLTAQIEQAFDNLQEQTKQDFTEARKADVARWSEVVWVLEDAKWAAFHAGVDEDDLVVVRNPPEGLWRKDGPIDKSGMNM